MNHFCSFLGCGEIADWLALYLAVKKVIYDNRWCTPAFSGFAFSMSRLYRQAEACLKSATEYKANFIVVGWAFRRGVSVPLFSWFPRFWKFSCARISAFSFIFSLFLAFLPNFTLFFLGFCLWPLTPLFLLLFIDWIQTFWFCCTNLKFFTLICHFMELFLLKLFARILIFIKPGTPE